MFTSDRALVMLGKKKQGCSSVEIKTLSEQHFIADRQDHGIHGASKQVSVMHDIEFLLRTVYTLFSRSSVKKGQFKKLAKVTECDEGAFKPLKEGWWLSRHYEVCAPM
jgi:hypothetical protein